MATSAQANTKVRQILGIQGKFDDTERSIASASSGATQIVLSTPADALHFKNGDTLRIKDDDANEINAATADGVGSTGVVTVSSLGATYDATPVVQIIRDELLNDTQLDELILDAIEMYSKDRPRPARKEVIGNGEHEIELPSDWIDDGSDIMRIEYPAGDQIESFLDDNDYKVVRVDTTVRTADSSTAGATSITMSTAADAGYFKDGEIVTVGDDSNTETNWVSGDGNTDTGVVTLKNATANSYSTNPDIQKQDHILIISTEPVSSEMFVLHYSGKWAVTTIPDWDYEAVTHLMASVAAYTIAALFAKKQDSTMDADTIDFQAKSAEWREIAQDQEKMYNKHMGIGEDAPVRAEGITGDIDTRFSWDRQWFSHGGRSY